MNTDEIEVRDRLDVGRLAGHSFGIDHLGRVWVSAEVYGNEAPGLWQLLEAHAAAWRALSGTRKRVPAHRLKLCSACGTAALVGPAVKRCRCCTSKRGVAEVRLIWAGDAQEAGP